jgi:hypothetical protein
VRRKRVLAVLAVGVALVFGVLYLTMTATAAKSVKLSSQPECYGNVNESGGDTHANVSNGYVQTATFEFPGKSGEVKAKGWIKANMSFDVFGGSSMHGHLVADFYVNGYGPGHFESKCIVEGETTADGDEDEECDDPEDTCLPTDVFAGEFEGTATGLPNKRGSQAVVAQLAGGYSEGGKVVLHLAIERGTACFETNHLDGGNNETNVGKSSGSINADDVTESRDNFPDGC